MKLSVVSLVIILSLTFWAGCSSATDKASESAPVPDEKSVYERFLIDTPEASEGFTEREYEFALAHLELTPEVMEEPELFEAFNAKIKIEEDLLVDLGLYPPTEQDWEEIILANWNDVYFRLYKGGESYGTIIKSDLEKRIPDEKDREVYYMGLWVPRGMRQFSPYPDWSVREDGERIPYNEFPYDRLRGREAVVENLKNLSTLSSNTIETYNNPALRTYERAKYILDYSIPDSFPYTEEANSNYIQLYEKDKEISLTRFIHGITYVLYSGDRIGIEEILCKSLGLVVFEQRAPYNHGEPYEGSIFTHGEPAFVVPKYLLDEIQSNPERYGQPIIGLGQSIGWVSSIEAADSDGIPYIEYRFPQGIIKIRLDETYKLNEDYPIIEREDLYKRSD